MESILYIGMDVHTTNYTLCSYMFESDKTFGLIQVAPDYLEVVKYVNRMKRNIGKDIRVICGYEAGCLGYSLYRDLTRNSIECVILAPSTIATAPNERKNDHRDAAKLARCLAYNTYKPVYIPDVQDDSVKEYIRMRDNLREHIKTLKQQILALCTRWKKSYSDGKNWTQKHMNWLHQLKFENEFLQETLDEYVAQLDEALNKIKRYDQRIEEFSELPRYAEKVSKLTCFCGIKKHTALATIVEISDFDRFATANRFAAYLGLAPGEHTSNNAGPHLGITKQGNKHIRTLLIESAQCYSRAVPGRTSYGLAKRQQGNSTKVITYANKGSERLKRRYRAMIVNKPKPVAVTAVARELACFIWGMMTEHYT